MYDGERARLELWGSQTESEIRANSSDSGSTLRGREKTKREQTLREGKFSSRKI